MPRRSGLPPYRLHKATGQALVHVDRKDRYLGPYGSEESKQRYEEICRQILLERSRAGAKADAERRVEQIDGLSMVELIRRYLEHAKTYYRKHGRQTSEYHSICSAVRPIRVKYPDMLATAFGPQQLKEIRAEWVKAGIVRDQINKRVHRIRRMLAWGVAEDLVLPLSLERLSAVDSLKRGRTPAREGSKILPVEDWAVEATLPYLNRQVRAMVEIQRLTGMRPGEVVLMRTADLEMGGDVWAYTPHEHKTEHHDQERVVMLGPRAIEIVRPWLRAAREEYLFSAAEAEAERREEGRSRRKTKLWPSHVAHQKRKKPARPRRMPGPRYKEESYRRAITKGIRKANQDRAKLGLDPIPYWLPRQLRHSLATRVSRLFGDEHAKSCLGHTSAQVTKKHYIAPEDLERAREAMRKIG